MFFLYISSFIIILNSIIFCAYNKKKKINKFDYIEEKKIKLSNIYFYKDNKLIKVKEYNKSYNSPKNLEFNLLSYNYFILEYTIK